MENEEKKVASLESEEAEKIDTSAGDAVEELVESAEEVMEDSKEETPAESEQSEIIKAVFSKNEEPTEAELPEKRPGGSVLLEWGKDIVIAIGIALVVMQFIKPTIVQQRSMEPNFYTNDYILVSKQSYKLLGQSPKIGDVIIFATDQTTDKGEPKLLIKRVIGVPGDVVTIRGGKVYINGEEIDDSYTAEQFTTGDIVDLVVPENKLFCLGDNRSVSIDSRSTDIGFVDFDSIVGKAVFRLYPFNSIGSIKNPYS